MRLVMPVTALWLALLWFAPARAADGGPTEYQIKAAFLFNFANFTTWPDSTFYGATAPFVIAILGDDPFNGALDPVQGKVTTSGRTIRIERVQTLADLTRYHMLFICESERNSLSEIIAAQHGRAVLTLSDDKGACDHGAMIGFFNENNKIRFNVNLRAVEASLLRVDPRVLKLGRIIAGGDQ